MTRSKCRRQHESTKNATQKPRKERKICHRFIVIVQHSVVHGISRRCCLWLFIGIGVGYRTATSTAIAVCIEQWQTFTLTSSHTNWFWKTKTAATDTKVRWGEWETSGGRLNFDATFRCGATFFSLIVRCSAFTSLSTSVVCRLPSQDSTSNRNLITTQWTIKESICNLKSVESGDQRFFSFSSNFINNKLMANWLLLRHGIASPFGMYKLSSIHIDLRRFATEISQYLNWSRGNNYELLTIDAIRSCVSTPAKRKMN